MTENEALKTLEDLQRVLTHYRHISKELTEANGMAIQALEEIQQYRAIGTIDEFKALKEKNEPKKIDIWANGEEHCPFCDKNLTTFYGFANCFSCGQKLDWQ